MSQLLNDFQKQEIKFDINKLKLACDEVLNIKGFDTSLGIPHFAGISLNQIPGDPNSIKGNNVRGVYWTKPDSSGKETQRDIKIDENKYTEFVEDFKNTYFLQSSHLLLLQLQSSQALSNKHLLLCYL